jgi:hypothetical protein
MALLDAQAAESSIVELLSPIAPSDAQAEASYGFRLFLPPFARANSIFVHSYGHRSVGSPI